MHIVHYVYFIIGKSQIGAEKSPSNNKSDFIDMRIFNGNTNLGCTFLLEIVVKGKHVSASVTYSFK